MATATAPIRSNGRPATAVRPEADRPTTGRRRRQLPLVVVGVLLVLGCALAFADMSLRTGRGEEVLVVAQPVAPGQVLTSGDLRSVRVSANGGLATVPADEASSVLGRPAAVALVPGAVLAAGDVGSGPAASAGSDVVAVGLKPGAYPPDLAAGDRVQVVPVASSSGGGGTTSGENPVDAVVVAVQPASATSDSPAVFSLQVGKSTADEVAQLVAADEASLVQVGG